MSTLLATTVPSASSRAIERTPGMASLSAFRRTESRVETLCTRRRQELAAHARQRPVHAVELLADVVVDDARLHAQAVALGGVERVVRLEERPADERRRATARPTRRASHSAANWRAKRGRGRAGRRSPPAATVAGARRGSARGRASRVVERAGPESGRRHGGSASRPAMKRRGRTAARAARPRLG